MVVHRPDAIPYPTYQDVLHAIQVPQSLPNLTGVVVVFATLTVPRVILQEAFLSFLGLGVPEPYPSWGRLAAEGVRAITTVETHWWLVAFPSLMIVVTLYALHLIGDGLSERESADSRDS